jgi:hypothetical protein
MTEHEWQREDGTVITLGWHMEVFFFMGDQSAEVPAEFTQELIDRAFAGIQWDSPDADDYDTITSRADLVIAACPSMGYRVHTEQVPRHT